MNNGARKESTFSLLSQLIPGGVPRPEEIDSTTANWIQMRKENSPETNLNGLTRKIRQHISPKPRHRRIYVRLLSTSRNTLQLTAFTCFDDEVPPQQGLEGLWVPTEAPPANYPTPIMNQASATTAR